MGIFCTRKLRRCKKKWAMKSPYRTSQVPQPTFGSGSGNLGTIGHAAAIKWGHVAPWTCLAAWLGLPAHFLQGPLPCRVYNQCAKITPMYRGCTLRSHVLHLPLASYVCSKTSLFWECISFIVAVSHASNHFVCSLWKHVIHAVSVLGVLAGAKEQFWGIQAQTALCIYVGQNIHCRF